MNCEFSLKELEIIKGALKDMINYNAEQAMNIYNWHRDKDGCCTPLPEHYRMSEDEARLHLAELRGRVSEMIKNSYKD